MGRPHSARQRLPIASFRRQACFGYFPEYHSFIDAKSIIFSCCRHCRPCPSLPREKRARSCARERSSDPRITTGDHMCLTCNMKDKAAPRTASRTAIATVRRRTCHLHPSSDSRILPTTFPRDSHKAACPTAASRFIIQGALPNLPCPSKQATVVTRSS